MPRVHDTRIKDQLWELGLSSLQALETERGILASGREEIYGCIFGRDSLITSLTLLRVYEKTKDPYFLSLVRKVLFHLAELQGREINIESGEEPGKCIHEYRTEGYEHLIGENNAHWYLYPDKILRNYDSVDATPLFLMTVHAYYRASHDDEFIETLLPNIKAALDWIFEYGDTNGDGFIDYRFHPDRTYGGLRTQSWMDSTESLFHEDGRAVPYPIAPVEVQAYTYVALRAWAEYFETRKPLLSEKLEKRARELKILFNTKFVLRKASGRISLAFAIDGNGDQLRSPRSTMGHVLWAVWRGKDGMSESVLDAQYVARLAERLLSRDLYVQRAGVRTLSNRSRFYDPASYHNGSIWPHDTAMLAEGLENFGLDAEARRVRTALLRAYVHFETPIELFTYSKRSYHEYSRSDGMGGACRNQAWSAAALLALVRSSE